MTYTTEADIHAMAEAIAKAKHDLSKFDSPRLLILSYKEDVRLMISASPVHAELDRLSNELWKQNDTITLLRRNNAELVRVKAELEDQILSAEMFRKQAEEYRQKRNVLKAENERLRIALRRIEHAYRPITPTTHSEAHSIAKQALQQKGGE